MGIIKHFKDDNDNDHYDSLNKYESNMHDHWKRGYDSLGKCNCEYCRNKRAEQEE